MKKKIPTNDLITFIPVVLLVMLWGYAAISKIAEFDKFVAQIKLAPVPFMKTFGPILGWLVPLVELVLVGMFFTDRFRNLGMKFSFVLLLVFEIYIAAMLLSGLELPCTCGGLISRMQWREHLIFNAVFMLISVFPFLYHYILNQFHSSEYSPQ